MYFYQIKTRETYCYEMSSKHKTPDFDAMPILGLYEIYMYVLSIYFQLQNNVKNVSWNIKRSTISYVIFLFQPDF